LGPFRYLFLSILFLLVLTPLPAQYLYDGNNNLPPFGSFAGSSFDTVSLQNGNLHLHIPMVGLKQRGGKTLTAEFVFDLPSWTRVTSMQTINSERWYITSINTNFTGWNVSTNGASWEIENTLSTVNCPAPTGIANIYQNYIVRDPEGTKHPLNLYYWPGPGCGSDVTVSPTFDGSGIIVNIGTNPQTITLKDGSQVILNAGAAGNTLEDTNGNQVNTLDTLDRSVFTNTHGSNYDIYTVTDDNGNQQNYRVDYTTVAVLTNFCPTGYKYASCAESKVPGSVFPSKLTLPDGSTYQFSWVQNDLGELQSVTLPTGATISYTYVPGCMQSPLGHLYNGTTAPWTCKAFATSRTMTVNGVASTWKYGGGTVTDPYGNDEVHTYGYVSVNGSQSFGTVETDVSSYQGSSTGGGTILRHVHTDYTGEPNLDGTAGGVLVNIRPIRKTTTLDNGLVTKTETDYETFTQAGTSQIVTRLNPTEVREYDYASGTPGALLRKTDYTYLHNNSSTYTTLNIVDRPASITVYDGSGNKSAQTTYEYDVYNHPGLPTMGASGAVQHDSARGTSYTTRGNQTAVSKWLNTTGGSLSTLDQYDDAGNVIATKDPNGNVTNTSYVDTWANTACAPSGPGKAFPTAITDPLGHLATMTYNSCTGSMATSKDQNDINASRPGTVYSYDLLGRPTQILFPDGGQTTNCYTDVGGSNCSQTLPPFQMVTSKLFTSSAAPLTTTTFYDGLGRVTKTLVTVDPDCSSGDGTDITYDALSRVHTVSNAYCTTNDPTYGLTTYAYDALGRTTQVTHPDNSTIPTSYTGRATQAQDEGNGSQRVTRISQVDGLGRLTYVCEVAPGPFVGSGGASSSSLIGQSGSPASCGLDIPGSGFLTSYKYDVLGNLLQVNQGTMAPRTFAYDSLSRLTSSVNPESNTSVLPSVTAVPTTFSYDANGNLSSKTAPAPNQNGTLTVTTNYTYDALNRMTAKLYSDGTTPASTFLYDSPTGQYGISSTNPVGRLVQATSGCSFTLNRYDPVGRVVFQVQQTPITCDTPGGFSYYRHTYVYDLMGNMTSFTDGMLETFTYGYNGVARLTSVTSSRTTGPNGAPWPTNLMSSAHYNALGSITSDTLADSESESWAYNNRGWLTSQSSGISGSPDYSLTMNSYAPNGDVLAATDSANGSWNYSYDQFNRLVCANLASNGTCKTPPSGAPTYTYVYDRFGNRWQQNGQVFNTVNFTGNNSASPANTNRVDGYSYDTAGNLTNDGTYTYSYDAENRLISVVGGSSNSTYTYDALGHRVKKTGNANDCGYNGITYYLNDLSDHAVVFFPSGGNNDCHDEIYAGGRHLATYAGGLTFNHSDWLGTERVRHTYGYTASETCSSLPFGDNLTCNESDPGVSFSPLHFTGKERDSESGLDEFDVRYYASSMGRFMRPDPAQWAGFEHKDDPQAWNGYAYGRDNPLLYTDPDGANYTVCDANGQNCADLTDKQYDQFRQDNPNLRVTPGGDIYTINQNGTETRTGSESYYNEKDVAAAQTLATIGSTLGDPRTIGGFYGLSALGGFALYGAGIFQGGFTVLELGSEQLLTNQAAGQIIGWGTGQAGTQATEQLTQNLTKDAVQEMIKKGLNKATVEGLKNQYARAAAEGGAKMLNQQLLPRLALMEKIIQLWPK
jgi:RHS repeat-associated protein